MKSLTKKTLCNLVDGIKKKEFTSEEITNSFIDNSEKAKILNTYITTNFDKALDEAKATIPHLEHRPYVGLRPTVPVKDAGCLIDPPVSVPIDVGVRLAAKAEAEPPDEPPGINLSPYGFITLPKKLVSLEDPIANSSQLSLPNKKAPSLHKFEVTVDS